VIIPGKISVLKASRFPSISDKRFIGTAFMREAGAIVTNKQQCPLCLPARQSIL